MLQQHRPTYPLQLLAKQLDGQLSKVIIHVVDTWTAGHLFRVVGKPLQRQQCCLRSGPVLWVVDGTRAGQPVPLPPTHSFTNFTPRLVLNSVVLVVPTASTNKCKGKFIASKCVYDVCIFVCMYQQQQSFYSQIKPVVQYSIPTLRVYCFVNNYYLFYE